MAKYDYDLFVIGGGSGGVRAGRMAAGRGVKVGIAEEFRYGGTCVIRGCVPKKLFVYASHFSEDFEDAAGFGWHVGERRFDWATLIANKDTEISRLSALYERGLKNAGADILHSRAGLRDAHTIHLSTDNRTVTADKILIATGGWPSLPEIPGIEHAITSNEAFHLPQLPRRVVVAGGGYIAVEFAGIFHGLGVETTLAYRGAEILRGFDMDIRAMLRREMVKKGVDVRVNCNPARIEKRGAALIVTLEDGGVIETDCVLYATGRKPNIAGLGLDAAGVAVNAQGAIAVDEYSHTNVENIWALGDVTDRVNLTPVAIHEAMCFVSTVFGGKPVPVDHELIPTAVFSQPSIGTCGLTEEAARQRHKNIDIYKADFRPMKHTLSGREERMLMKLIVDGDTDKVLGCHILGADAGEIIQALGVAIKMGATKADFDATMAVHPTAAEEFVTMREKWTPPAQAAE
ncbi:MAG TPA: glutathione-disulfide reductase [Alphaproteobacteria bacterium]|nr:glutathione-disulfide reductase [Alphaproteobacteria bacterium]